MWQDISFSICVAPHYRPMRLHARVVISVVIGLSILSMSVGVTRYKSFLPAGDGLIFIFLPLPTLQGGPKK